MATLTIDWALCQAHGVCAAALGEQITRDKWGYPRVGTEVAVEPGLEGAARMAVATCPAAALRLRQA